MCGSASLPTDSGLSWVPLHPTKDVCPLGAYLLGPHLVLRSSKPENEQVFVMALGYLSHTLLWKHTLFPEYFLSALTQQSQSPTEVPSSAC